MKRFVYSMMWLGVAAALSACSMNGGPKDWGAVVVDLRPADTLASGPEATTLERPWIGFGLASDKPGAPQPTPSTLHVRLRTGSVDELDPKAQQLDVMEVRGIDIGRPISPDVLTGGPIVIAVDPPGASITLTGKRIDWPYGNEPVVGGIARISFNRSFREAARRADPEVTAEMLLKAALMGVTSADLRQYAQLELMPTIAQIIDLVQGQVTPSEIQSYYLAGYAFDVEELLSLKSAGVSVENAAAFAEAAFRFDAPQLITLHEAGVSPAYARGLKAAGFAEDVGMLVRLRQANVEPAYAQRMRELGVAPHVEALVRLHEHAITPESVETFQQARYDFDAEQLITLQTAGVSARDTLYFREAGYDFTMAELMRLAKWRVPASFTLALVADDFALLSADQIIDLRLRRITPEQVRILRQTRSLDGPASGGSPDAAARALTPLIHPLPLEPLDPEEAIDAPADAEGQRTP